MSTKTIKNKLKIVNKTTIFGDEFQSKTASTIKNLTESQVKTVSLREGLEMLGFTNIEIDEKTYRYRSGFAERDGKLYYFCRNTNEDCTNGKYMTIYHREARDRKDLGGGHSRNQWSLDKELEEKYGARFSEPRCRHDYNDLEDYELALEERKNQPEIKTYIDMDDIDYEAIVTRLFKKAGMPLPEQEIKQNLTNIRMYTK